MPVQIHNIMLISTERKGGVLGKKAIRSINVDWDTWYEAKRILKAEGYSLSEAIEGFLKWVIEARNKMSELEKQLPRNR